MADSADRNLPASAKKIRKARQEGNVPRSRDLGHFVAMGLAAALMFAAMPWLTGYARHLLADGLTFDRNVIADPLACGEHAVGLFTRGFMVVLMVGGAFMAAGVASNVAFGGWNLSMKAVSPNFGRINPIAGFGRLFSAHQLISVLKACLLAIVIGCAGTIYLKNHFADLGGVLTAELPAGLATVGHTLGSGFLAMLGVLAAWAMVDVAWQKKSYMDKLKMSKQEQKQEHKEAEGNVEVKAKMKQKMREMARRRMMKAVPAADIVVMNPTHYAVALKYDQEAMGARAWSPRAPTASPGASATSRATPACPCSRRRRWPVRSTRTSRSTAKCPRCCSPPSRRCLPGCTSCAAPPTRTCARPTCTCRPNSTR